MWTGERIAEELNLSRYFSGGIPPLLNKWIYREFPHGERGTLKAKLVLIGRRRRLVLHPTSKNRIASVVENLTPYNEEGLPVYDETNLPANFLYRGKRVTGDVVIDLGTSNPTQARRRCRYLPGQRGIKACIFEPNKGRDEILYDIQDVLEARKKKTYPPAQPKTPLDSADEVSTLCRDEDGKILTRPMLRDPKNEKKPWYIPFSNTYSILNNSPAFLGREIYNEPFIDHSRQTKHALGRDDCIRIAKMFPLKKTPKRRKKRQASQTNGQSQRSARTKVHAEQEMPQVATSPPSFEPNVPQKRILAALDNRALPTDSLAKTAEVSRRKLFDFKDRHDKKKRGYVKDLQDRKLVALDEQHGWYRPDKPPQSLRLS